MGKCSYCGENAGFLKNVHPACSNRPSDTSSHQSAESRPSTEFEEIGVAVLVGSARASKAICDELGLNLSAGDKWKVDTEVLGFLLHFMSRRAYAKGGPDLRDAMQDEVVPIVIETLIKTTWNASNVKEGFDVAEWEKRVFGETLENINSIEFEYGQCSKVLPDTASGFLTDDSAAGKLAGNIVEIIEVDDFVTARMMVCLSVTKELGEFGFSAAIDKVAGRGRTT
jgi:hypothetical protein